MALREIQVGDVVRVDEGTVPHRVEAKDAKTGMLVLEVMHTSPRVVWSDVHEFRCSIAGAF